MIGGGLFFEKGTHQLVVIAGAKREHKLDATAQAPVLGGREGLSLGRIQRHAQPDLYLAQSLLARGEPSPQQLKASILFCVMVCVMVWNSLTAAAGWGTMPKAVTQACLSCIICEQQGLSCCALHNLRGPGLEV